MEWPVGVDGQSPAGVVLSLLWAYPVGFCFSPDAPVGPGKKPVEKCHSDSLP